MDVASDAARHTVARVIVSRFVPKDNAERYRNNTRMARAEAFHREYWVDSFPGPSICIMLVVVSLGYTGMRLLDLRQAPM